MKYRKLGNCGLKLSELSFGSWVTFGKQTDESRAYEIMSTAYDAGVNFFDNAEVYAKGESEIIMGNVLKKMGWGRDTYCVSSKVFWGGGKPTQLGLSRKHIFESAHAALRRLRVDYLDLYFCHRPDLTTPIEETVRAMGDLVQQGKVLYWGTSEWSAQQITEAFGIARELRVAPPTMEQPQFNLLHRDRMELEYLPLFKSVGLGTTIWSPLASGLLTGKYLEGIPVGSRFSDAEYAWLKNRLEGQMRTEKIKNFCLLATRLGASPAQLAISWCLRNPHVSTVILGASNVQQLKENLKSADFLSQLDGKIMTQLDQIFENKPPAPPDFLNE